MNEEDRLQCVKETLDAINDHLIEGGTYRYLIYERLGFDVKSGAYFELMSGLNISNAFCELEELKSRIDKAIKCMDNTFNITCVKDMFDLMNNIEEILKGGNDCE